MTTDQKKPKAMNDLEQAIITLEKAVEIQKRMIEKLKKF